LIAWQLKCIQQLQPLIAADRSFRGIGNALDSDLARPRVHLAVFMEPYLSFILDGKKTVESRFSCVRCAPYNKVRSNDVILLKKTGGPVTGICRVAAAWFYQINPQSLKYIQKNFAAQICPAESDFWSDRSDSSFATLISLADVTRLPEFRIHKRDRRGWVTFA
jgi:hypothetical protein